ncbi:MAG: abortive infection family protein [Geminicoccaceae bacterium]|nr:abortive infection family protein [Geminicoccaceae bacterium]
MDDITECFDDYLATVAEMLDAEGMSAAVDLLRKSSLKIEETGYDNWNGGTTIYTAYLLVDPADYARMGSNREVIEEQIQNRIKAVLEQFTSDWYNIKISPKVKARSEWRKSSGGISRTIRQDIIDLLKLERISWSGCLEEVEFLQRIYDLESLPSHDPRFKDAAGDIWQHRVNNPEDWEDSWIYDDQRFELLSGHYDIFLRFICETVHPVVRPERNETLKLVRLFNERLRLDGWCLVEEEKIAGRSRFVASRLSALGGRSGSRARTVADALDAGWMKKEIERLENSVDRDPALAIGTAKDLLETCCKTILSKRGVDISRKMDLPELTKQLAKELQLVPQGIPEEAKGSKNIRLILHNLAALTQYLAELRGLYGSGHGRDGKYRGLEPRHARLAVGAAVTFIDFVTETYHQRF